MSRDAEAVLEKIRTLSLTDQRAVLQELEQSISHAPSPAPVKLYGEPLTDHDIDETARATFQMLDEEEKRADSRKCVPWPPQK